MVEGETRDYSDGGRTPSQSYDYRVIAANSVGSSPPSVEVVGTSADLPKVAFELASSSAREETGSTTVVVKLLPQADDEDEEVTADIVVLGTGTASGADHIVAPTTSVSFAPGETTATVTITLFDDTNVDQGETVVLGVANVSPNAESVSPATHTVTLEDDERARVAFLGQTSATSDEQNAMHPTTLRLSLPGPLDVDVRVEVSEGGAGTATADADYDPINPTVIVFPAGSIDGALATFSVGVRSDGLVEGDETVLLEARSLVDHAYVLGGVPSAQPRSLYWYAERNVDRYQPGTGTAALLFSASNTSGAVALARASLFHAGGSIQRCALDGSGNQSLSQSTGGGGLAVDAYEGKVYYRTSHLHRMNLDGSGVEVVQPNTGSITTRSPIAADGLARWLYWLDYSQPAERVFRSRPAPGSTPQVLATFTIGSIQSMVVDPVGGWIYYYDDLRRVIERVDHDFANTQTIATDTNFSAVAVDVVARKLYWSSNRTYLHRSELDGSAAELYLDARPHMSNGPAARLSSLAVDSGPIAHHVVTITDDDD